MSVFFYHYILIYYIQSIFIIYICTHLPIFGLFCGSAEQPPLGPSEKTLNQPKHILQIELFEGTM